MEQTSHSRVESDNADLCTRWIVSQEGSRRNYALPLSFHRLGLLRLFYVDIWWRWGRSLLRRGPKGARALATRFHPELPLDRVISFNRGAIVARTIYHFRRPRLSPTQMAETYCRFGEWLACSVRDDLGKLDLAPDRDCFFGFNTNCLETLEMLRKRGIPTVVGQVDPGRIEEDIVLEEAERWPGWAKTPGRMPQSYWDRLKKEWDLADLVSVNSDWCAEALVAQGVPRSKIVMSPLAIDLKHAAAEQPVKPEGNLKVLWLGTVILRKGIQYLAQAARLLAREDIEFIVAGPVGISRRAVDSLPNNMRLLGRITRDQVNDWYRQAHVFVLPTLSEGFAVTQLEAMANGLPVVATRNCGAVVTHGVDGWIVPARDARALADALFKLNRNRGLLREMSQNALGNVRRFAVPENARSLTMAVEARRRPRENGVDEITSHLEPQKIRMNRTSSETQPGTLPKAVVCFSGARDHYQLAWALAEAGLLEKLVTDLYLDPDQIPFVKTLGTRFPKLLARHSPGISGKQVITPFRVAIQSLLMKTRFASVNRQIRLDQELGRRARQKAWNSNAPLFSCSYYAASAFAPGNTRPPSRFLFQLQVHPKTVRKLLSEEMLRVPRFAASLRWEHELGAPEAHFNALCNEPGLANGWVTPSSYAAASLAEHGVPRDQIHVVPHGVDAANYPCRDTAPRSTDPFRIVWVGSMAQRKGLSYFLEALASLPQQNLEALICGHHAVDRQAIEDYGLKSVHVLRGLPTPELTRIMRTCDLFVLPSLAESFGHVILEAMSSGLPVITTASTCAPDVLVDGEHGFIVPIRDAPALANRIRWGREHRAELYRMGLAAAAQARLFTWERFRHGIVKAYRQMTEHRRVQLEDLPKQVCRIGRESKPVVARA